MSFEIVYRGPGIKQLDPLGNPIKREPLFKPLDKPGVETRSGDVGVDVASSVMTDMLPLLASGAEGLKTLAVKYLKQIEIPKLAVLAAFMYQNRMVEPDAMLKLLSESVLEAKGEIQALETEKGFGEAGRLTIGGIFKPGVRLDILDENRGFALSALAETFLMATRDSGVDSDLTKILPQFAPKPKVEAPTPFNYHTINLAHQGFCGCPGCRDTI